MSLRPRFPLCLLFLAAAAVPVRALTVEAGTSPGMTGYFLAPAIIEGKPAIAYTHTGLKAIRFIAATDANGSAWGTPVNIGSLPQARPFKICMVIADGKPLVCYYRYLSPPNGELMLARALDALGTAWAAPVGINLGGVVPREGVYAMEMVGGRPAICFASISGSALYYVRALDAGGMAWGAVVAAGGFVEEVCLKVVDGRPAIASNGSGVQYRRAADAAGDTWEAPVLLQPPPGDWRSISMQVVNGRPAVCYTRFSTRSLYYQRAMDTSGAAWPPAFILSGMGYGVNSMAVINGKPAIGFVSSDFSNGMRGISYSEATDSDGDTLAAWRSAVFVDSGVDPDTNPSLLEVNGAPALVYHDYQLGRLRYTRAGVIAPAARWPPAPVLTRMAGGLPVRCPDGGTVALGGVRFDAYTPFPLTLTNPNTGSDNLLVLSTALEGPDATGFSLENAPAGMVLTPQNSLPFTLRAAAPGNGMKSAALRVTGTISDVPVSYVFKLTASVLPDFSVEQPVNAVIFDGGSAFLPLTPPGQVRELVFTIKNTGTGELDLQGITIDGPDSADFWFEIANGFNTFTVRHAPSTPGRKTAALHIASNVPGDKNPFDITLRSMPGRVEQLVSEIAQGNGTIGAFAVQGDGKILTGGPSGVLDRLHPDGRMDPSFFSPALTQLDQFPAIIACVAAQKDGAILLGGRIDSVNGVARSGLARLRSDGTLDASFAPPLRDWVLCLAVQPDGRILLGGTFVLTVDGVAVTGLARLHADGTPDAAFRPVFGGGWVSCLALQPDGKILAGGNFTLLNGSPAQHIVRLNPDGSRDAFAAAFAPDVNSIVVQPDGKILAGSEDRVVRLQANGGPDGPLPEVGLVRDLALQADGKCLVGTDLVNNLMAPNLVARINPDRTLDADFFPDLYGLLTKVTLGADGRVFAGGDFTRPSIVAPRRFRLALLGNDPAGSDLTLQGRTTVRWLRSGSAPEVRDVTVDVKPAGAAAWTPLGSAVRVPGGWELSGLTLPSSGTVRAQAYAGNSVMEATAILGALGAWRMLHFGITANTGDAADDADPDKDGLTNLVEFAFGLSPVVPGSTRDLPPFVLTGNTLTATFTAPAGTEEDVVHRAEWSGTLTPGSWTAVPDTGEGAEGGHTFSVPAAVGRVFVRFVVGRR